MGNASCQMGDHADCSNNSVCGSRGKITQLLASSPKEEPSIFNLKKARQKSMMSPQGDDITADHYSDNSDAVLKPEHRFHSQASPVGEDDKENRENYSLPKKTPKTTKKSSTLAPRSPHILDHCDNCSLCIPSQPQTARTEYEDVPNYHNRHPNMKEVKEKSSRAPLGRPPAHPTMENAPAAVIPEAMEGPRRGRNPTSRPPMVPPLPSTKLQELQGGGSSSRPLSPAQTSSARRRNRSRGSSADNRGGLSEREFGAKMRVLSLRRELGFDQGGEAALAL